jgi:hypothetical protein
MRPRLQRLLEWLGVTVPQLDEERLRAWLEEI